LHMSRPDRGSRLGALTGHVVISRAVLSHAPHHAGPVRSVETLKMGWSRTGPVGVVGPPCPRGPLAVPLGSLVSWERQNPIPPGRTAIPPSHSVRVEGPSQVGTKEKKWRNGRRQCTENCSVTAQSTASLTCPKESRSTGDILGLTARSAQSSSTEVTCPTRSLVNKPSCDSDHPLPSPKFTCIADPDPRRRLPHPDAAASARLPIVTRAPAT
jgi:hypothetical protein